MITPCPNAQKILSNVLQRNHDEGFFLFVGPRGVDLTGSAFNFFKASACRNRKDLAPGDFCGRCTSCLEIERRIYPDLMVIQVRKDKSEISIDEFDPLKLFMLRIPHYGSKYLIVLKAEDLSDPAARTSLKTLEEPKENTVCVFLTHYPWMLPAVVLSRAFQVAHRPVLDPSAWDSPDTLTRFWDGKAMLIEETRELFDTLQPIADDFLSRWSARPTLETLLRFTEPHKNTLFDDAGTFQLFVRILIAGLHDRRIRAAGGECAFFQPSPAAPEFLFPRFDGLYEAHNLAQTTYVNRRLLFEKTFAEALPA